MALHSTPSSMVEESLDEFLKAAKYCVEYRKVSQHWGKYATGGCLGYPGAILLFSIVDSIGSYFRNNKEYSFEIDGQKKTIDKEGKQHFYVLNGEYFNQNLSEDFIEKLYSKFRSFLIHNAVIGKDARMEPGPNQYNEAFYKSDKYVISMVEFLELCKGAVQKFQKDLEMIVSSSKHGKKFN